MRTLPRLPVLLWLIICVRASYAAIDYSSIGATYDQLFNTLETSNSTHGWTNDSTIEGWSLFRVTGSGNVTPVPITAYHATTGTASDGRFYSFGGDGMSDRALGGIGNGQFGTGSGSEQVSVSNNTVAGWIAVSFANATGVTLDKVTVGYSGEQWRDAGNEEPAPQTMVLEYGIGDTFETVSWTPAGPAFNFTSPVATTTEGPIDGNTIGKVAGRGGMITGLAWAPDDVLWLRWIEHNDIALDHGLAIDDLSFSATAVPEPSAFFFGGLAFGSTAFAIFGRRILARASRR